jgi:hypothetical protein
MHHGSYNPRHRHRHRRKRQHNTGRSFVRQNPHLLEVQQLQLAHSWPRNAVLCTQYYFQQVCRPSELARSCFNVRYNSNQHDTLLRQIIPLHCFPRIIPGTQQALISSNLLPYPSTSSSSAPAGRRMKGTGRSCRVATQSPGRAIAGARPMYAEPAPLELGLRSAIKIARPVAAPVNSTITQIPPVRYCLFFSSPPAAHLPSPLSAVRVFKRISFSKCCKYAAISPELGLLISEESVLRTTLLIRHERHIRRAFSSDSLRGDAHLAARA